MNLIDLSVLVLFLFFLLAGALSGFMPQLKGILIWVLSIIVFLISYKQTVNIFLASILAIAAVVVANIALWVLFKVAGIFRIGAVQSPSPLSRLLGAVLSAAKGVIFIALFASLVNISPAGIFNRLPRFKQQRNKSQVLTFFAKHNILLGIKMMRNIYYATLISENRRALNYLQEQDDAFKDIVNDPKLMKIMQDEELRRAFEQKDILKILSNPEVRGLLKNKEFMRKFNNLDLKAAYEKFPDRLP
jgi:uncharacterized membrane protein required for colicin V production